MEALESIAHFATSIWTQIGAFALVLFIEVYCQLKRKAPLYSIRQTVSTVLVLGVGYGALAVFLRTDFYLGLKADMDGVMTQWMQNPLVRFSDYGAIGAIFKFTLALLWFDFCVYWIHRWMHSTAIGWSLHEVHHISQDFNVLVTFRQSPLYLILVSMLIALAMTPMGFLEIGPAHILAILALENVWVVFQHTRAIDKCPAWIEAIFVTPSHHRVHHAVNDVYIDRNFGALFILWDRMFKTFTPEQEDIRIVYGVTDQVESLNPLFQIIRGPGKLLSRRKSSFAGPAVDEGAGRHSEAS